MSAAVGKMCEPRLKSQRIIGRERDAGWDLRNGMSKRERVAMPPDARRAVVMLMIWMGCMADMTDCCKLRNQFYVRGNQYFR